MIRASTTSDIRQALYLPLALPSRFNVFEVAESFPRRLHDYSADPLLIQLPNTPLELTPSSKRADDCATLIKHNRRQLFCLTQNLCMT